MNKALKKYKKAKYRNTRLCFLNWTIEFLAKQYSDVTIELLEEQDR